MSEEATNANIAVPWAMMGTCAIGGVLGWGAFSFIQRISRSDAILSAINVALTFCMGKDIENIMADPVGQPMATVRAYMPKADPDSYWRSI